MPTLEKAYFLDLTKGGSEPIKVMFNPTEVAVKKTVPWNEQEKPGQDQAKQQFTSGKSRGISLKLEFDTSGLEGDGPDADDVRQSVDPILALANVPEEDEKAYPPCVEFGWGQGLKFTCVIASVNVTYTRFNLDGVPTRASMQVELLEVNPGDYEAGTGQQVYDQEVRTVQEGQTVSQASGDTSQEQEGWRDNTQGDENPRRPETGPRPMSR